MLIAVRAVAAPPAPGPGHQEPAPGHRLHGVMRQRMSAIRVIAASPGACTVMRATTGRAAPGSGNEAPPAETVLAVTASRLAAVVRTATTFARRPDRRADPDVTVVAVDDAMMTDRHDRKAHYLLAPDSVPAPLLFPASDSFRHPDRIPATSAGGRH